MGILDKVKEDLAARAHRDNYLDSKARAAARYDIRSGTSILPSDAERESSQATDPETRVYWKSFGSELRRQGLRG